MAEDFYCDEVFSGKTPVEKVRETENVLAYKHTRPFWETHIVVVPKKHIASLLTLEESDAAVRVLTNLGDYQDSKHLHFHINSGDQILPDHS